jgi:tetratricopeptide (TPR) repeat protein
MEKTYGPGAPAKLIAAYAAHLETPAALERSFGVKPAAFESGYREFVRGIAAASGAGATPRPREDAAQLEREAAKKPNDAALLARTAYATFAANTPVPRARLGRKGAGGRPAPAARRLCRGARAADQRRQGPRAQRAARRIRSGAPQQDALALLAALTLEAKDYAAAESLYTLGQQRFPLAADWLSGLAESYRGLDKKDALEATLVQVVERDPDDLDDRKELATLALARNDLKAAGRWSTEALGIDVTDAEMRALRTRALAGTGRP